MMKTGDNYTAALPYNLPLLECATNLASQSRVALSVLVLSPSLDPKFNLPFIPSLPSLSPPPPHFHPAFFYIDVEFTLILLQTS